MKLRIQGNSVRFRLTRSELARLSSTGRIENAAQLGPGDRHRLVYALQIGPVDRPLSLEHRGNEITIFIPPSDLDRWKLEDQVGIEGSQRVDGVELHLLVEKDFACVDRADEDQSDAFPNPEARLRC